MRRSQRSRYAPRHARRRSRDHAAAQDRLGVVLLAAGAMVVAAVGVAFAATYHPSDIDRTTGCPAGNRAPTAHTIILVDETDQLNPDQLRNARALIQTEYMWLPMGGRLTVRGIVADPGEAKDIAVVCRMDDGSHANAAIQNAHAMKHAFERTVGVKLDALYTTLASAPVQDASPIMEAASAALDRPDFGPNVKARRLVILSDFAQHSDLVSQYGHGLDLSHRAKAELRRDMDGVEVRLHYIDRPNSRTCRARPIGPSGRATSATWAPTSRSGPTSSSVRIQTRTPGRMSTSEAPARARGERRLKPGFFSDFFGRGREAPLDLPAAMMIPIVGAMLADGIVEEEELFQIDAVCAFSPIFERNTSYENELLILRATRLIEDHGLEKMCRQAAELLSPALRETAFVYAVKVIFSDGRYGEVEQAVIRDIREALEISPARADTIIDVISVMRRTADA